MNLVIQTESILSITKRTPGKNTIESYSSSLSKLCEQLGTSRQLDGISSEEVRSFLNKITEEGKQQTKHGRYSHLKAFFNSSGSTSTQTFFQIHAYLADSGLTKEIHIASGLQMIQYLPTAGVHRGAATGELALQTGGTRPSFPSLHDS